ncbi:MAG TPA: hypothetical protein VKG65_00915 [Terriglobales bacterium]|nr:hypothetical protein [Terriglobales bacterium]
MSHFLNKLARQTLGPSEAIQPRVPSIYEPYRRAGVPEWAEPAARERGPAPADEIGSEASADVESIRAAESRPQEVHREEVRGRVPLPRHADVAQEMQHTDGLELPLRSALATPVSPDRERTRRSAPESRPLSAVVRRSQVERIEPTQHGGRASATSGAFLRGLPSDAIAQSSPTVASGLISSTVSSLLSPRIQPVVTPTQATPTGTMPAAAATQGSERIDLAIARLPANLTTDSEPVMRVTIGRVEVRAVFPAPAPRRAQPARPRPTLSLDDYLKRGARQR